jgi:hypothetical protein
MLIHHNKNGMIILPSYQFKLIKNKEVIMNTVNDFYTGVAYNIMNVSEHGTNENRFEVNGTGELIVTNTGGSSAGDGGMGSGSTEDTEKGDLVKPGEKSGTTSNDDDSFDPIKKSVKEAERKRENEQ